MKSSKLEKSTNPTFQDLKNLFDFTLVPSGTYRFIKNSEHPKKIHYFAAISHDLIKLTSLPLLLYETGKAIVG